MIITVTPNAALDVTYEVDTLTPHTSHRVRSVNERAGGKGVNVASVLASRGYAVLVSGCAGGTTGAQIRSDLDARNLAHSFARSQGEARRTLTVVSNSEGDATVFNEPGPTQSPAVWPAFLDHLEHLVAAESATVVVLSGSLPPGFPVDGYAQMVPLCQGAGARVILDADGEPFRRGLAAGPDLIKPNQLELAAATGVDEPELGVAALCALGARDVVVSAGPNGLTWYATDGTVVHARLEVSLDGNPTGAGDALVAALAAGMAAGRRRDDVVRDAVAWSAAAVLQPVAGVVSSNDISQLEKRTLVRVVR